VKCSAIILAAVAEQFTEVKTAIVFRVPTLPSDLLNPKKSDLTIEEHGLFNLVEKL
tara:strand:+ start:1331 stop:1498 length:168 start_codon:yes stop_codon:yes gene_type:complete